MGGVWIGQIGINLLLYGVSLHKGVTDWDREGARSRRRGGTEGQERVVEGIACTGLN